MYTDPGSDRPSEAIQSELCFEKDPSRGYDHPVQSKYEQGNSNSGDPVEHFTGEEDPLDG